MFLAKSKQHQGFSNGARFRTKHCLTRIPYSLKGLTNGFFFGGGGVVPTFEKGMREEIDNEKHLCPPEKHKKTGDEGQFDIRIIYKLFIFRFVLLKICSFILTLTLTFILH